MDRLYNFSQFVSDHTTYINYIVDPVAKYAVEPVTNRLVDCISDQERVNLIFIYLQKDSVKKAAAPLTVRTILVLGSSYFLKTTKLKNAPFLVTTAVVVLIYAFFTSLKFLQIATTKVPPATLPPAHPTEPSSFEDIQKAPLPVLSAATSCVLTTTSAPTASASNSRAFIQHLQNALANFESYAADPEIASMMQEIAAFPREARAQVVMTQEPILFQQAKKDYLTQEEEALVQAHIARVLRTIYQVSPEEGLDELDGEPTPTFQTFADCISYLEAGMRESVTEDQLQQFAKMTGPDQDQMLAEMESRIAQKAKKTYPVMTLEQEVLVRARIIRAVIDLKNQTPVHAPTKAAKGTDFASALSQAAASVSSIRNSEEDEEDLPPKNLQELLKLIEKTTHQPMLLAQMQLSAQAPVEVQNRMFAMMEPQLFEDAQQAYPSMKSSEEGTVKAKIADELQKLKRHCQASSHANTEAGEKKDPATTNTSNGTEKAAPPVRVPITAQTASQQAEAMAKARQEMQKQIGSNPMMALCMQQLKDMDDDEFDQMMQMFMPMMEPMLVKQFQAESPGVSSEQVADFKKELPKLMRKLYRG